MTEQQKAIINEILAEKKDRTKSGESKTAFLSFGRVFSARNMVNSVRLSTIPSLISIQVKVAMKT